MTDHDLLKLAAKAAGYKVHYDSNFNTFWVHPEGAVLDFYGELPIVKWNPLKDDGDALRLAVKLRLRVCTPTTDDDCALASNGDFTAYSEDDVGDQLMITDNYVATRRAIVRAAAEIGKTL